MWGDYNGGRSGEGGREKKFGTKKCQLGQLTRWEGVGRRRRGTGTGTRTREDEGGDCAVVGVGFCVDVGVGLGLEGQAWFTSLVRMRPAASHPKVEKTRKKDAKQTIYH